MAADGILIVDKPEDFTSFDLCAKLRGMLHQKRIGHAGTLDPMATGVMTVLLGGATRAAELLPIQDKRYVAGFRLGERTDTLDVTGSVLERRAFNADRETLESVIGRFRGEITQLPPMYSAVHSNGRRLYELARAGVEVEREPRTVNILALELLSFDERSGEGTLDVFCSKGTYIRTLVDDIGSALGCGAVMTSLRRTMAAGFSLDDALTLDEIAGLCADGRIDERILPVERALEAYPSCVVTDAQAVRYHNGGELFLIRTGLAEDIPDRALVRVSGADGFIGIGVVDRENGLLRPYKRFN